MHAGIYEVWMELAAAHGRDSHMGFGAGTGDFITMDGEADKGRNWPGRWIFFLDCRMLSGRMEDAGTSGRLDICKRPGGRHLDAYGPAWRKGEWVMGTNAEKETAVSALCDSGVDLDAVSASGLKKREVSASYTVEASFVMAIALFLIAALLNGVFEVHGRITGRFVLQEAMERCLYREEKSLRGTGSSVEELSSKAQQHLRGFFRCADAVLWIREEGGTLEGTVKSSTETGISLRGQDPERAIRLMTVQESWMEAVGRDGNRE